MFSFEKYLSEFEQRDAKGVKLYLRQEYADMLLEAGIDKPAEFVSQNILARGKGAQLELEGHKLFLKQYFRGGVFSFFLGDRYFSRKRFLKEIAAYEALKSSIAVVPVVFALVIETRGLFFRAWLVTEFIEECTELHSFLENCDHPGKNKLLVELGKVLRFMHNRDISHPDLTLSNICIGSDNRIILLDFDRCAFSSCPVKKWLNLFRFHRSCVKTGLWKDAVEGKEKNDIDAFLRGYLDKKENKTALVKWWFSGYRFWEKAHSLFWKNTE